MPCRAVAPTRGSSREQLVETAHADDVGISTCSVRYYPTLARESVPEWAPANLQLCRAETYESRLFHQLPIIIRVQFLEFLHGSGLEHPLQCKSCAEQGV